MEQRRPIAMEHRSARSALARALEERSAVSLPITEGVRCKRGREEDWRADFRRRVWAVERKRASAVLRAPHPRSTRAPQRRPYEQRQPRARTVAHGAMSLDRVQAAGDW